MVRRDILASPSSSIIPLASCVPDTHPGRRRNGRTYTIYASFAAGLVCTLLLACGAPALHGVSRPPNVRRGGGWGSSNGRDPGGWDGGMGREARDAVGSEQEWWIETLNVSPRILKIHNLLTKTECDHLINLGIKKGLESALITPYGTHELVESTTRTNKQAWLDYRQDSVVANLEDKLAEITNTDADYGENLQILHYNKTQQFMEHHDYFDPATDPPANFEKGGNRLVTVLIYLHGAEVGGETHFMKIGKKLTAATGDALMFYNLKHGCDGTSRECVDKMSAHAGLPPIEGEKWVATKWIHERKYQDEEECADMHDECAGWAARDPSECALNRAWMLENCRLSCTDCDTRGEEEDGAGEEDGGGEEDAGEE